jgi:hypothetical protein
MSNLLRLTTSKTRNPPEEGDFTGNHHLKDEESLEEGDSTGNYQLTVFTRIQAKKGQNLRKILRSVTILGSAAQNLIY